MTFKSSLMFKIKVFFLIMALAFLWFTPWVFILKLPFAIDVTYLHKTKGAIQVKVGPNEGTWVPIKKASPYAVSAIIVAEDSRFYEHSGLDFEEIEKSYKLNSKKGHYARGASTITQQVVRLAFLDRKKSMLRKIREAWGAVLLELIMSKEEILEWYINLADFGDDAYGLRSASKKYFSTRPELLTVNQAVHLALILPNPNGWSKGLRSHNLTSFGRKRFAKILRFLLQNDYINKSQWQQGMASGNFGGPIFNSTPIPPKPVELEAPAKEDIEDSSEPEEDIEDALGDDASEEEIKTAPLNHTEEPSVKDHEEPPPAQDTKEPNEANPSPSPNPSPNPSPSPEPSPVP